MNLPTLYEDDHMMVVDKPSGLLVHPSWITAPDEPTLMGLLKKQLAVEKLHTVHRLDRATSGVILVAKTIEAGKHLQMQFQNHTIIKRYECVVRGWFENKEGTVDHALVPKVDKFADPLARNDKDPKEAVTDYRVLNQVELEIPVGRYQTSRYSRVECFPKTGRKHQIRRHMKHLLHPIIGDTKHGEGRHNRMFREQLDSHRLLLMARGITFEHPKTGETLTVRSDLPNEVISLYQQFDWL